MGLSCVILLVTDVDGPGAIVRLWTAAINGEIRMYIDGAEKPVFEGSANEFFHRQYDHFPQMKEVDADRFGRTVYQRDVSYAPMPFAKHLRVVWTGSVKKIHFYQLQVRLYDKDAKVVSFRPEDIHTYRETIDRVALAMTPQSGEIAFHLDGKPLQLANRSDGIDLYRPYRTLLRNIVMMPVELSVGDHNLELELKRTSERVSTPEIGIDFIWVQRR